MTALLVACSVPSVDETPVAPPVEVPVRYWLRNVELLDAPEGKAFRRVVGPVLIELWRDGRVRSSPDAADRFEGYLPRDVLEQPQRDRGLALVAQRQAELHLARPDGPVVGRVHPGAMVSVRPGTAEHWTVGGYLWGEWIGFVARNALGTEATAETAPASRAQGWALVPPYPLEFLGLPTKSAPRVAFAPCYPVWFPVDGDPSQRIDGVELSGRVDVDPERSLPRYHRNTQRCQANVVVEYGGRRFRVRADGSEMEVEALPRSFTTVAPPQKDPLLRAIAKNASVFWLEYAPPDLVSCAEARFERFQRRTRNQLIGAVGVLREQQGAHRAYDMSYFYRERAIGPGKPMLRAVRLEPHGQEAWGNDAEYLLLAMQGEALLMMGLPMRGGAVAFDPDEAERWFVSREACLAAGERARGQLERHSPSLTSLGFHVAISDPDSPTR